jgi:hypothetical protein
MNITVVSGYLLIIKSKSKDINYVQTLPNYHYYPH